MKERVNFWVTAFVPGWQAAVWEAAVEDHWSNTDHTLFLGLRNTLRGMGVKHSIIDVLK